MKLSYILAFLFAAALFSIYTLPSAHAVMREQIQMVDEVQEVAAGEVVMLEGVDEIEAQRAEVVAAGERVEVVDEMTSYQPQLVWSDESGWQEIMNNVPIQKVQRFRNEVVQVARVVMVDDGMVKEPVEEKTPKDETPERELGGAE